MSPASLAPNAQLMLAFGNLGNKQLTGIFTTIGCLAQTGLTCFLYILDTKVQSLPQNTVGVVIFTHYTLNTDRN